MSNISIKTAASYVRRSPFQALAAIGVLALTFFVATMVTVLTYSSSSILKYFETRPQVIAFLKSDAKDDQISALQTKLLKDDRIKEVKYVSREDAVKIYQKATSDNPLLGQLVSPSIFPPSLEFSVVDISLTQNVIADIRKEAIVDSVGFTASLGGDSNLNDVITRLKTITLDIRWGGAVFVGFLTVVSLFVLLVIISMRLATRKEEIEILNLIGATPGFIRGPIIFEAMIYSVMGAFLGWISALIVWLYATPTVTKYFGEIPVLPTNPKDFFVLFLLILGGELIVGLILALFGSVLALSRANKRK